MIKTGVEKLKTLHWFARNRSFWSHALALAWRTLANAGRHERSRPESRAWAARHAVSAEEALTRAGLFDPQLGRFPQVPEAMLEAGQRRAAAAISMGGPADLQLLHAAVVLGAPSCAIETGVAYGWSSLVILAAMEQSGGRLISVDMPYAKRHNESWVGIVVPESMRHRWTLIREPDRNGLKRALSLAGGAIDLCHYDSDKSFVGRMYAYPMLWNALRPGGLFISDDIQDNFAFRDFCNRNGLDFQITESAGKYVGLIRKPLDMEHSRGGSAE